MNPLVVVCVAAVIVLVFLVGVAFGYSCGWTARANADEFLEEIDRRIAELDRQIEESEQ